MRHALTARDLTNRDKQRLRLILKSTRSITATARELGYPRTVIRAYVRARPELDALTVPLFGSPWHGLSVKERARRVRKLKAAMQGVMQRKRLY